jgi:glutamate 5-kinase
MNLRRTDIGQSSRWVIKIGSALITADGRGLDRTLIESWVEQIAQLRQMGKQVVLVSSGAVAEGMARLQWKQRPSELYKLQAAAAVGQMGVVQTYESFFQKHGLHTAQVLLTHEDLANRERYLNARSTLQTLLDLGVVPVINENDTVATAEIRLGDNDTLGGLVTNLLEADLLVILTDQQGLFSDDPRKNPQATLISEGQADDPTLLAMASPSGGALGRGGMQTKLLAAQRAAKSGAATWIAWGRLPDVLLNLSNGDEIGTLLLPSQPPIAARKRWLASHLHKRGTLWLNDGAADRLCKSGASLLAVGVIKIEGTFQRGEMVICLNSNDQEIARGLINYNADETRKIIGQSSDKFVELLGYIDESELIHRDNLILV